MLAATDIEVFEILLGVHAVVAGAFWDALLRPTILIKHIGILHRLRIIRFAINRLQRLIRQLISRRVYIRMIL